MLMKCAVSAVVCIGFAVVLAARNPSSPDERRASANEAQQAGNFRDAYEVFRELALDPRTNPRAVGGDLEAAIECLRRLNRVDEVDAFREQVIQTHSKNWRLLHAAARTFIQGEHFGYIVAGEFHRGNKEGGGQQVTSFERDRVRALQLMEQALPLVAAEEGDVAARSEFHLDFARFLLFSRGADDAWRLQYLTDLSQLPDYEEGGFFWFRGAQRNGAPVDAEGKPVFHYPPESYEAAQTDGERWRFMLARAAEIAPNRQNEVRLIFANFLDGQFGVRTLLSLPIPLGRLAGDGDTGEKDESGPYALHTLGEDETIARLATGVKRFPLPNEFNFIRIFQQVADSGKGPEAEQALNRLASIFEDRRQLPKAAQYWSRSIEEYGAGASNFKKQRLEQITGNWGRFENAKVHPAGKKAAVDFRFRNGNSVQLEAFEVKLADLLADMKAYLKSNPRRLDQHLFLDDLGTRLVSRNEKKYLGERVAEWTEKLEPRENHFDRRVTIDMPLEDAGVYLVTAKMAGGNTSRIIVWISDTVIARKQLNDRVLYYVADAVTGKPIEKANVEFLGFAVQRVRENQFTVVVRNFAEYSDAHGQIILDARQHPADYQWLAIARKDNRLAYLGFQSVWYEGQAEERSLENKVFVATDRPVYRPEQAVKFNFWVRQAGYGEIREGERDPFAHQTFKVRITGPRGDVVFEKTFESDEYGGFAGEYVLPEDAALGQYFASVVDRSDVSGGGSFRVEEYKKPEYEVTVEAPDKPVMLGEKIAATIRAKYYFGAPVTNATVHYKVTRTEHSAHWFPPAPWDWFYGPGYWWFASDYDWYPGFSRWGCFAPRPHWWPVRNDPPEVVLDNEVPIGPDGTVAVQIDTAIAKEIHPDQDHRYEITVEVVDQSRRTIVGTGEVLVARLPFQVYAWLDRGYYRDGEVIQANFKAQTLDRKPVQGKGTARLFRVTYDQNAKPTETEIETWDLDTNDRGEAALKFNAPDAGQYRLSYTVVDAEGRSIEGGYVFTVTGDDFDGKGIRFDDLELIPDKPHYAPGDTVKLMINTNRAGGTVLLFVRPSGGVYPKPQVIRLDGKSTIHEIKVEQKDMPNFFVEAITVAGARVHTAVREVLVPPEKRIANVEVLPSADTYKPGEPAKVQLKLTDLAGNPFKGSTVVTVYDKSVEYISGGSNVPDIREFFWKWRRSHYPQTYSSLDRVFQNLLREGETGMADIGAFGHLVLEPERGEGRAEGERPEIMLGARMRMAKSDMAAAAPMAEAAAMDASGAAPGGGAELVEPTVRKEFADTAYWVAGLTANEQGIAEISLKMPENLTTWKIRAWTLGAGTVVGQGEAEVITSKNVLVRLQAPRFFTETDEVVLSAIVHNYLKTSKTAHVVLELEGGTLENTESPEKTVEIAAGGEARVDWRVKAVGTGEAIVRMKALTDEESDAMQMTFPVYVHGMLKMESYTGVIRPDGSNATVDIRIPEKRRPEESRLEVRFSPTLAGALVDALPYLVDYPYGCTEQTLNRFLPTVITQNVLKNMNLNLAAIREKRTNLNAQELGDPSVRAAGWKRYDRNPVFDEAEVARMVKDGLEKLTSMQLSDGGWGWFSGWGERSYPHTTAVVVHGLQIAQQNGVAVVPDVLERGIQWLKRHQAEQLQLLKNAASETKPYKRSADNIDAFVFMVLVDADAADREMLEFLHRDRTKLSVYAKGMFGLALSKLGEQEKLEMIVRNIDQFLIQDEENQTAYLRTPESTRWYWYGSDIEANAYYLKLLARTDPQNEKASRLVKYLLNNRKHATYWNSTRDTAVAIEAMAAYMRASGEDRPDLNIEIFVDGQPQKQVHVDAENLFSFNNTFVLAGSGLTSGAHTVELRKSGTGPLYYSAYVTNFTLEDFITSAGLEIKVNRKYYRLIREDAQEKVAGSRGQAVDQRVEKYRREELSNLDELQSGELVEVELEIDSKNDYEYLVFEDMKAAGFEPVDLRSGYSGNSLGAYTEYRDEKVNFFVRWLPLGKHSVSYRMRAEVPGKFSALPTKGYAMYAPELRGNSDEIKLSIRDRGE